MNLKSAGTVNVFRRHTMTKCIGMSSHSKVSVFVCSCDGLSSLHKSFFSSDLCDLTLCSDSVLVFHDMIYPYRILSPIR